MRMIRKPSFVGKVSTKDTADIFFWAFEKTPFQRICEAWRLNCLNNGVEVGSLKLNKTVATASKRNG